MQMVLGPALGSKGCSRHGAHGQSASNSRHIRACRAAASAAPPMSVSLPTPSHQATATQLSPEAEWRQRVAEHLNKSATAQDGLASLRSSSLARLQSERLPSVRDEEYRFTDITPLLSSDCCSPTAQLDISAELLSQHVCEEASSSTVVVVDGVFRPDLSRISGLPSGIYIGSLADAPQREQLEASLNQQAHARGGAFVALNGAGAQGVLAIWVGRGVAVPQPIHILHVASGSQSSSDRALLCPRMLLHASSDAVMQLVEEFVSPPDSSGAYFTCSVAELALEDGANVMHGYVQREHKSAFHMRSTCVSQAKGSSYQLVEATLGGQLTRHDVSIAQGGEETSTSMRHFLLSGSQQLHDLHSKLELSYPRGVANQLHKCIVSHATGKGIFDGNVKVNKLAQKTDAGQLSRNLLLVPRATVHVKPNLQIIADDVKCTHGASISDLSAEELFYFRARGISQASARQALVYSFGAEVVQGLKIPSLTARISADVGKSLRQ